MSAIVVVPGRFTPGSVVGIYAVDGAHVLRPRVDQLIEERIVDKDGNVGFEGLEVGARYFVSGYVGGRHELVRATGQDPQAPAVAQAPIGFTPQPTGTQEAKLIEPPPQGPDAELAVGVAPGAAQNVALSAQEQAPGTLAQAPEGDETAAAIATPEAA